MTTNYKLPLKIRDRRTQTQIGRRDTKGRKHMLCRKDAMGRTETCDIPGSMM